MNIVDRIISPNLWDEVSTPDKYISADGTISSHNGSLLSTNFIKVNPNTNYYIKSPASSISMAYYDVNQNYLGRDISSISFVFTTPINCVYIKFSIYNYESSTYNHDICINESNPSINGKYFPYVMYKRYDMVVDLILPREYQKVEYIESTGTQYIDSGFYPNSQTKIDVDFLHGSNNIYFVLGAWDDVSNAFLVTSFGNTTELRSGGDTNFSFDRVNNEKNTASFSLNQAIFNGNTQTKTNTSSLTRINKSMILFGRDNAGNIQLSEVRIYSNKIYDNNTLVRNFIPCYRKADNVIGLYDTVNNQFYTNAGTGTFLKGANVSNYKRLKIGG